MSRSAAIRKLLTVALILIFAAPVLLLLAYQVQLCYNRFEMLERLEEESLHTITIPKTDLHWAIPGKEIRLGSRLFDVKDLKYNGDFVQFSGLFDDEEAELEKLIRSRSSSEESKLPFLVKLAISPGLAAPTGTFTPYAFRKEKPHCNENTPMLISNCQAPAAPPPREQVI